MNKANILVTKQNFLVSKADFLVSEATFLVNESTFLVSEATFLVGKVTFHGSKVSKLFAGAKIFRGPWIRPFHSSLFILLCIILSGDQKLQKHAFVTTSRKVE